MEANQISHVAHRPSRGQEKGKAKAEMVLAANNAGMVDTTDDDTTTEAQSVSLAA